MYELTKLVLLKLIAEKANKVGDHADNVKLPIAEVKEFITGRVPILTGIVANESPIQVSYEVETSVKQLNLYAKKLYNKKNGCLQISKDEIVVNRECIEILEKLLKRIQQRAMNESTLMEIYANTILSV